MATTAKRSNLETVKAAYEAFNAGDMSTLSELFSEDLEWVEPEGSRNAGTYEGIESVMGMFGRLAEEFEAMDVSPERFIEDGDTVVVLGTTTATARETGIEVEVPFAHCCDMDDGLLARFQNYNDTATFESAFEA